MKRKSDIKIKFVHKLLHKHCPECKNSFESKVPIKDPLDIYDPSNQFNFRDGCCPFCNAVILNCFKVKLNKD